MWRVVGLGERFTVCRHLETMRTAFISVSLGAFTVAAVSDDDLISEGLTVNCTSSHMGLIIAHGHPYILSARYSAAV